MRRHWRQRAGLVAGLGLALAVAALCANAGEAPEDGHAGEPRASPPVGGRALTPAPPGAHGSPERPGDGVEAPVERADPAPQATPSGAAAEPGVVVPLDEPAEPGVVAPLGLAILLGEPRLGPAAAAKVPPEPPPPAGTPRPSDPEFPRVFPGDGEAPVVEPLAAQAPPPFAAQDPSRAAPRMPRPGDPEFARESISDGPESAAPAPVPAAARPVATSTPRPGDPEFLREPVSDGRDSVGSEPPPAVARRVAALTPRPGDPEWGRDLTDAAESPSGAVEAAASGSALREAVVRPPLAEKGDSAGGLPQGTARPGDPELVRDWPSDDPAVPVAAAAPPTHSRDLADPPRFVLGEGPDTREPEPPAVSNAEPPAAAAPPRAGTAPDAPVPPQAPGGPDGLATELAQVKSQNDRLAELRAEAEAHLREGVKDGAGAGEGEDPFFHVRDPKAIRALRAFRDDAPLGQLEARVVDAGTRQPLPARVRVVDASDTAAAARLAELGFWCNGAFSVPVIAGHVHVEISTGRFYPVYTQDVQVPAGRILALQVVLPRPKRLDFASQGWFLADLEWSVHTQAGEQAVWAGAAPELPEAVLAAQAEGLRIVGLTVPEPAAGEAAPPEAEVLAEYARWRDFGLLLLPVFPGPQHSLCGSARGLGMSNWRELPRYLGEPRRGLVDCFEELRAGGGLAVFSELQGRRTVDPRGKLQTFFQRLVKEGFYLAKDSSARLYAPAELPYATLAGPAYDALGFDGSEMAEELWFNLLNEGYAVPSVGLAGGSLEGGRAPFGSTLLRLDGPPTRESVLRACRQGTSAVTFGPAVFARVLERDRGPGERLPADGSALTLRVRALAALADGAQLDTVEIIRNGTVVHEEKCANGLTELQALNFPLSEDQDAWYVVRVTEKLAKPSLRLRRAWTNPLYFDTPGRRLPEPARSRMRGLLRQPSGRPLSGTVTVLEPGRETRAVAVGLDGRYDVELLAAGTLVFSAPGCEPVARKPFDDPHVQRALGAIHAERDESARRQLSSRVVFATWRLLLADLVSDVELPPLPAAPAGSAGGAGGAPPPEPHAPAPPGPGP